MNCLRGFISAKRLIVALESIAPVTSLSIDIRPNACLDRCSFNRLGGSQVIFDYFQSAISSFCSSRRNKKSEIYLTHVLKY